MIPILPLSHQTTLYIMTPTDIQHQPSNTHNLPNIHQQDPKPTQYQLGSTHDALIIRQVTSDNLVAPTTYPTSIKQHQHISFVNLNQNAWRGGKLHSKLFTLTTYSLCISTPTLTLETINFVIHNC